MQRRTFLKLLAGSGALAVAPRIVFGTPQAATPFWINIQASGGWDPALTWDPKADLRSSHLDRDIEIYGATLPGPNGTTTRGTGYVRNPAASELRSTPNGGIQYLGFADLYGDPADPNHPYKCFLPTYYDRVTIFSGVDTGTNNHSVGERYCAGGSSNEGVPCFSSQIAAALGDGMPLAFMNFGGYDQTANLVPTAPLNSSSLPGLLKLTNVNDISGDNSGTDSFYDPASLDVVQAAHRARTQRLAAKLKLPGAQRGLTALQQAEDARAILTGLKFNAGDQSTQNAIKVSLEAYRKGLAVSLNLQTGGFDSHQDNEVGQAQALDQLFELIKFVLQESEAPSNGGAPVPVVVVVTSDFGRTPYYTMSGTDHWPTTSMMVVQNAVAKSTLNLAIPTNTVIGGTTSGDTSVALKPMKVNPQTLKLDSNGIVITPGHVVRALRRLAKIDTHPKLAPFPLTVDQDLAIG